MTFIMKWTEALKQRFLGQKLDVVSRDGEVFARYDTFHVELDSAHNLTIELRQGKHVLMTNSTPVMMSHGTSVCLTNVGGEIELRMKWE